MAAFPAIPRGQTFSGNMAYEAQVVHCQVPEVTFQQSDYC